MAINFRESNEARWVGVRPGHKGTQIVKDKSVDGGFDDLYQPLSGEIANINEVTLGAFGTATGLVGIDYTTSLNVLIARLILTVYITGEHFDGLSIAFPEPLELSSQQKLRVYSSADNCTACGFCKGRVE